MNEKLMKSLRSYFSVLVFKNFCNKSLEIRLLKTQFSPMVLEAGCQEGCVLRQFQIRILSCFFQLLGVCFVLFFFLLERQSLMFLVGALIQSRGHLLPVCLVIFIFYMSVSVSKLHPFIKYQSYRTRTHPSELILT